MFMMMMMMMVMYQSRAAHGTVSVARMCRTISLFAQFLIPIKKKINKHILELYTGWKSNPVIIDCRPCGPVTSLETPNRPVLIFCCLFYKAVSNQTVTLASNGWVYDELEGTWKEEVLIKSRDCGFSWTDRRKHEKPYSE
jgi:hypothetical protein